MLTATYQKHSLIFNRPAGTSRGILYEKDSWFLLLSDSTGQQGIGECSLLPGLSPDDREGFREELERVCANINTPRAELLSSLTLWPSIRFGLEMALTDLAGGGKQVLFASPFVNGEQPIPINGLIWMGDKSWMLKQLEDKLKEGYQVLKLKVGAIDFEAECAILASVRERFGPDRVTLRLDANGAFTPQEAERKLERLARYQIHSIEQPIAPGQPDSMSRICQTSPIPVALDEELIGCYDPAIQQQLLEQIRPAYIILKPSLLGGFAASEQWITAADQLGIGWWVTSALESNIGLNAIAQWSAQLSNRLPQGLGTGSLYCNNFASPLRVEAGALHYHPELPFDLRMLGIGKPVHWQSMPLLIGGETLQGEELRTRAREWLTAEDQQWQELGAFLIQWLDHNDSVSVSTSGSTGTPKVIALSKIAMMASAHATAQRLGLYDHKSALLALSLRTVAGMMMVVRAMLCRLPLELVPHYGNPLRHCHDDRVPQFAALVPAQVFNALQEESSKAKLRQIRTLILGGGDLPRGVEKELLTFPNAVYHTFGMTETYSHIALRRVNGPKADSRYRLLPGVEASTDQRGCLVINAPHLGIARMVTNDMVQFTEPDRFEWLGRYDHVVNRGGQKLIAESLEIRIAPLLDKPFFVAAIPHDKLGEVPALMIEGEPLSEAKLESLKQNLQALFDRKERPVAICFISRFVRVGGEKVNRRATADLGRFNIDDWITLV